MHPDIPLKASRATAVVAEVARVGIMQFWVASRLPLCSNLLLVQGCCLLEQNQFYVISVGIVGELRAHRLSDNLCAGTVGCNVCRCTVYAYR